MENVRPEGTEDQFVTSTSGESLGRNVHVRRYERIKILHIGITQDSRLLESGRMTLLQV